jgi:hypothetical protein
MFKIMPQTPNELPGITGPGVAPVAIAEVNDLVDQYVTRRNRRMELTALEVESKRALIALLRANTDKLVADPSGTIVYRHNDLIVTLRTGKDELKVRTEGTEQENED